jgi:hypothetical protein
MVVADTLDYIQPSFRRILVRRWFLRLLYQIML